MVLFETLLCTVVILKIIWTDLTPDVPIRTSIIMKHRLYSLLVIKQGYKKHPHK